MGIYIDITKFSFFRFFSYPFEILATAAKRIVEILFLILFWSILIKSSQINISLAEISSYFLIAIGVSDLTMTRWGKLSYLIGDMTKSGQISNYIVKPVRLIPTLYSMAMGRSGMTMTFAVMNILIGLIINPPKTLISVILFLAFFVTAIFLGIAENLFEGILFLHFTDASAIRNSIQNFMRLFTGALIPIYLFPDKFRQILRLTPFPGMVYGPTNSLNTNLISLSVIEDLGIAIAWAVVLNIIVYYFWKRAMKNYEAVGI